MVAVCERALALADERYGLDFSVTETKRSKKRQEKLVEDGLSQTMDSLHLPQEDGLAHAVDLLAWVGGSNDDPENLYKIADCIRSAATELGVYVRWGGCWQLITGTSAPMQELVEAYRAKRERRGQTPFVDLPHFELYRGGR
jgi:peptidoglycan L-alanyl-D-glutamate endopeptidase CwlK